VIVGQFAGSTGIQLSFSSAYLQQLDPDMDETYLQDFEICIYVSSTFENQSSSASSLLDSSSSVSSSDSSFDIWDFGKREASRWVIPYGFENVSISASGKLCAFVPFLIPLNEIQSFIPIKRCSDWKTRKDPNRLTSSEIGVFAFLCFLYWLIFLVSVFRELQLGFTIYKNVRIIVIFVILACFIRGLYFSLVAGGVLNEGNTDIADFVLLEFPIFSYLTAVLLAAVIWYRIVDYGRERRDKELYIIAVVFTLISLVLLFIVVFLYIHYSGSSSTSCGGRLFHSASQRTQYLIDVVYRAIVIVITFSILVMFTATTLKLHHTLRKSRNHQGVQKMVTKMSIILALSLIAQCIFFICYNLVVSPSSSSSSSSTSSNSVSSTSSSSYEYALFLIPIEIIPVIMILFIIQIQISRWHSAGGAGSGGAVGGRVSGGRIEEGRQEQGEDREGERDTGVELESLHSEGTSTSTLSQSPSRTRDIIWRT